MERILSDVFRSEKCSQPPRTGFHVEKVIRETINKIGESNFDKKLKKLLFAEILNCPALKSFIFAQ